MKRFSAQYIITNTGHPLKRGIVTTEDDGTIINIEDTTGNLHEKHSLEFHNGIIIPGFVNCHCHLELSHMAGSIEKGTGLVSFIGQVIDKRAESKDRLSASAYNADNAMFKEGIVLCADVCNTSDSFKIKKESRISYISLLEVFGPDPEKAGQQMNEILRVGEIASKMNLSFSFVPHSAYSMSVSLLRLLREKCDNNLVTSIHFMESEGEKTFLENHTGPLMALFEQSVLIPKRLETVKTHIDAVMNEITGSGNLILVHNTFADSESIKKIRERKNLYWCLCPNSNVYIENKIPPLDLMIEEGCEIVIGTDSLASNQNLSILEEIKTLQIKFPELTIEELIRWATLNGAKALGESDRFGKIEAGITPGLLLLQNVDLTNMKLLHDSFVTRLI
jgi:cytosine/adenosine deaminase-related metal-dependent hydrolase